MRVRPVGPVWKSVPSNIEHISLIMELKRYKVLTLGALPRTGDRNNQ